MPRIATTNANFERAPLARPFGFKGGYVSELWQSVVRLTDDDGRSGVGLGTQSVLWSDARVFAAHSEAGGNALMFALTERALALARGEAFTDPLALQDALFEPVLDYARLLTGRADLRATFALNALVAVDFAAWALYARQHGIRRFDGLVPAFARPALAAHHPRVAVVPIVTYTTTDAEIESMLDAGYFIFKVKLGAPGTQREMLASDRERMTQLHRLLAHRETPHTPTGRIPYYLDANARYEDKATMHALLDHIDGLGALDRVILLEEPFPEDNESDVSDLGVCVAADESAHTDADARRRMDLGYGAIALKPIAKTLSMTLRIARSAHERGIPCFCADLTVNPSLLEWNKAVAARLAPFPGLGLPLIETNGHQNYRDWPAMQARVPHAGAPWTRIDRGLFTLDAAYYETDDLLDAGPAWEQLV
ncbi:MAG: hypothetical protein R2834_22420 [Rhodothermales bacterium]